MNRAAAAVFGWACLLVAAARADVDVEKYVRQRPVVGPPAVAAAGLEKELAAEVEKILAAGPLAPWIFTDHQPFGASRGDLYWAEPGETLYFLAEVAPVLPPDLREKLIHYVRQQRAARPPEEMPFIPLNRGARRERWRTTPEQLGALANSKTRQYADMYTSWKFRPYALYGLSRYYDLIGEKPDAETWEAVRAMMADQPRKDGKLDWHAAEFGPEVVRVNRAFAGMIGWARLADLAGDRAAAAEARQALKEAAQARLAVLGEIKPTYSYYMKESTKNWHRAREGELAEVHPPRANGWGTGEWVNYKFMVPELGRFLADHAKDQAADYVHRVLAHGSHWYMAYRDGYVDQEHNCQHPSESHHVFLAKAWILNERPEDLANYIDVSWLEVGDYFYLHKLAETIKTYRGVSWK